MKEGYISEEELFGGREKEFREVQPDLNQRNNSYKRLGIPIMDDWDEVMVTGTWKK